jgi:hypothetical protein
MDLPTLLAAIDFSHGRLLGLLDTIEKSGHAPAALAWRPGPGRAHVGWQAMHLAATLDRYLNARLLGGEPSDPPLVENFASGSTPADDRVPTLAEIRASLAAHHGAFRAYVAGLTPADLARVLDLPNNVRRTVGESIMLLTWHEAHHQGQIHLTWNCFKAAQGL